MEWFNGLGTSMIYKRCFYLISEKIFVFDVLRIRFIPYSILTIRIYNRDNPYSYMNPIAIRVRIRIRAEIWKQIWYQRYPFVSDPFSSLPSSMPGSISEGRESGCFCCVCFWSSLKLPTNMQHSSSQHLFFWLRCSWTSPITIHPITSPLHRGQLGRLFALDGTIWKMLSRGGTANDETFTLEGSSYANLILSRQFERVWSSQTNGLHPFS